MEQSLVEKMKSGTCDEIDRDMIVSRVLKAVKELQKVVDTFTESLGSLIKGQYADELKMAGATIVIGVAVPTISKAEGKGFELATEVIVGSDKNVNKALLTLVQDAKNNTLSHN